jgi:hypothetical protein
MGWAPLLTQAHQVTLGNTILLDYIVAFFFLLMVSDEKDGEKD